MKLILSILTFLLLSLSAFSAPLTDFEVQTQSGQLWLKLVEWRDAAVAIVAAERDALAAKVIEIEKELSDPSPTVAKVRAAAEKTELARKKQAVRDAIDKLNAEKALKQAELDALNAK